MIFQNIEGKGEKAGNPIYSTHLQTKLNHLYTILAFV